MKAIQLYKHLDSHEFIKRELYHIKEARLEKRRKRNKQLKNKNNAND
jgi:hypothetical protein